MKKKPESLMEQMRRVELLQERIRYLESRIAENLETQRRLDSRIEARQRLERRIESLWEAQRRIHQEAGDWWEFARVMMLIKALSLIAPRDGRPGGRPWPEDIRETLFQAVTGCADQLEGALEKAARYLRDPWVPISKKGGAVMLRHPAHRLAPPVGFAESVILTTIMLIHLRLEASADEEPLEPTKGEIKEHWHKIGWKLTDGQKWGAENGKRIWPEVFKEIGLDDLKQTPRKPSAEKKRRRTKRSR